MVKMSRLHNKVTHEQQKIEKAVAAPVDVEHAGTDGKHGRKHAYVRTHTLAF